MVDIQKHIKHWRDSAAEDYAVAESLIKDGRTRHGLFMADLAVEKMLKALICKKTGDIAPRTHNLLHLAEMAGLELREGQKEALNMINAYNIEGRYPDMLDEAPNMALASSHWKTAEEIAQWLNRLF